MKTLIVLSVVSGVIELLMANAFLSGYLDWNAMSSDTNLIVPVFLFSVVMCLVNLIAVIRFMYRKEFGKMWICLGVLISLVALTFVSMGMVGALSA